MSLTLGLASVFSWWDWGYTYLARIPQIWFHLLLSTPSQGVHSVNVSFLAEFYGLLTQIQLCTSCLPIFFALKPGIGIGDSDGQLGCSVHSGFAVLWVDVVSTLSSVRSVPCQQHFKLLDFVDQELPETTGQAACTLFSCCAHNQYWASWSGPWIFCSSYSQCLWVSAGCA